MKKEVLTSDRVPKAIGPYSQAVRMENLIFTSGQLPIDPASGALIPGDVEAQTRRVMENLSALLEDAGSDLSKALKATIYLVDIRDFARFNEVYAEYFPSVPPARSAFQVAALPLGARVEVELIASR